MDRQEMRNWNLAHPVGTSVLAKLPAMTKTHLSAPTATKTRSTGYFFNGTAVVMVAGASEPIPLTDIVGDGKPKFPVVLTTIAYDSEHLAAIKNAVSSINAENVDLHIEQEEVQGDGTTWITVSASTAQRVFHLGARVGKWLAEEGVVAQ